MPSVGPSRSKCPLSVRSRSLCLRLCRRRTATPMVSTHVRILRRHPHLLRLLPLLSVQPTNQLQPLHTLSTARWLACRTRTRTRTRPSHRRREPLRLPSPTSLSHPATTHSQLLMVTPQRYHHHPLLHPRSKHLTLCQTPPLCHRHRLLRRTYRSPTSHLLLPTTWRSMVCLCLHPQSSTPPHVLSSPMLGSSSSWQRSSPTWHTTLLHRWVRTPVLLLHLYVMLLLSPLGPPLTMHPLLHRLKPSRGDSPLKRLPNPQVLPPSLLPRHLYRQPRCSAAMCQLRNSRVSQQDIPQISPPPLCPSSTASLPKTWPCLPPPPPPPPHLSQQLPHLWSSRL